MSTSPKSPKGRKKKVVDPIETEDPTLGNKDKKKTPEDNSDEEIKVVDPEGIEHLPTFQQLYATFESPRNLWTGLIACGITDINKAKTLSQNLFMDNYKTCVRTTKVSIRSTFKDLAKNEGITVKPYIKRTIEAFHHWVKHCSWLGADPAFEVFPYNDVPAILEKTEAHERFLKDAIDIKTSAKPGLFTKEDKWIDWSKNFKEYLSLLPGETGLPLSYVIRPETNHQESRNGDPEYYIQNAPLQGSVFQADSAKVHIILRPFLAKHGIALSVVKSLQSTARCGREEWLTLIQNFMGEGMWQPTIVNADRKIRDLTYTGENPPKNTFARFERMMNESYAIQEAEYGKQHELMKIRNLLDKIKDKSLSHVVVMIDQAYQRNPKSYTYKNAMHDLRTEVLRNNQPNNGSDYNPRRIKEYNTKKKQQQYKHSRNNNKDRTKFNNYHKDSKKITLKDGRKIWFHPSLNYESNVWRALTDQQRDAVRSDRKAAREREKISDRSISQLESKLDSKLETMSKTMNDNLQSFISQVQSSATSLTSQIRFQDSKSPPSTMGGRNEQIQRRNDGGRTY